MTEGAEFIRDLAVILAMAAAMGWICQRVGLSVVVGYLLAGLIVGPHTPPMSWVMDEGRVETAAQVGLVFLMFGIGLRLSLRRLRRLGALLVLAVGVGALLIFYLTRVLAAGLGWTETEGMFLAGMLMVSSSAIISKVLQETGATHQRAGQLAMGITVLEDVVAVIMLTVLNARLPSAGAAAASAAATVGEAGASAAGAAGAVASTPGLGATLGVFVAFVVLAGIVGLLLVPWLLRRLSQTVDDELQTLAVAALLFTLAWVAHWAGYSLALGAFLLGTIVAETAHRHQIERTFEGMRDVFSAVFFVAIGMQIEVGLLGSQAGWILLLGVFCLVVRTLAATTGLILIGTPEKDALSAGLTVTPIGEFSFIIAQLGVAAGALPPRFYPLAVGISLLSTLMAPVLTRRAEPLAASVWGGMPRWVGAWLGYYRGWLERLAARQKRNQLWQLSRKRFVQIGVEVLLVSGVLVFAEQIFKALQQALGDLPEWPGGAALVFWPGLVLLLLAPLVAIWRNLAALALLYAQVSTEGLPRAARLAPVVEACLKAAAGLAMFVWLAALLPSGGLARWALLATVLCAGVVLFFFQRRLIYWHSELEVELQGMLTETAAPAMSATSVPWLRPHAAWNLSVSDCVLPDLAACQGRRIADLALRSQHGCSVVGIERQGWMIPLPPPESVLYARDKVLLLGAPAQVADGKRYLTTVAAGGAEASEFDEVRMETLVVPAQGPAGGQTLRELSPAQTHQVQVAGIQRGARRTLSPGGDERVLAGDELLVLGTPAQLRKFKQWLKEGG